MYFFIKFFIIKFASCTVHACWFLKQPVKNIKKKFGSRKNGCIFVQTMLSNNDVSPNHLYE